MPLMCRLMRVRLRLQSICLSRSVGLDSISAPTSAEPGGYFHHQQSECPNGEGWSQLLIQVLGGRLLTGEVAANPVPSEKVTEAIDGRRP
jgi:hypothetical protein